MARRQRARSRGAPRKAAVCLTSTVAALAERVAALESITPNTEKAAATAAQTALLIDRQYQLSEQLQAQQQAVEMTAAEVRELIAAASAEAAAAEAEAPVAEEAAPEAALDG